MPGSAPHPDLHADPANGWERALLDRQLARLDRLADLGMDIAAEIHRRVTTADDAASPAELQNAALDFSRAARAVRLTLALQSRLIADFKAPPRPAKAAAADEPCGPIDILWLGGREVNEPHRRAEVKNSVGRAAQAEGLDREAVERLRLEAAERLERDDYGDIMHRPVRDIIAEILRDLGLRPDWEERSPERPAREESISPIAAAMAGGGEPCGGQRFGRHANARSELRAGAAEEPVVEGKSLSRHASAYSAADSS